MQLLRDTLTACVQTWPQLESGIAAIMESSPSNTSGGINPQAPATFPQDVEEEANSYYERIYKGELSIPQIVEILSRFKNSTFPREQQVFKCMIHNLFDEYQFFPRYPDKELAITSVLFGSLIQNQIISSIALGVALRYVLEALRQPLGSKLFNFASQALYQFQSRLVEWPQYCTLLLQIPHLSQAMPDIIHKITRILNQSGTVAASAPDAINDSGSLSRQTASPQVAPIFTALKLDADLEGGTETPDETVHDKILFIMNNLSTGNIEAKVNEMREIFGPAHYRWFSSYIVKRASQEPNYHSLYSEFLDALGSNTLERHIIHETFSNVNILLNSEKTVASSQERTLLKNLGTWLGLITLSKNKPIKNRNLGMKELLLEGYDSSRLIVVIPFVCKVLEQGFDSVVFSPPNPWVMAIMKLLAELYHYANLKLNLKFEIEVLCKKLNLDIKGAVLKFSND
jgi:CCR4-NOT transcription complex subunit 1